MRTFNYERHSSRPKRCSVRCPQRTGLHAATPYRQSAETADATALFFLASRAIDAHDFSRIGPVFCAIDQGRSHGILEHVIPFRRVALVAPQEVIVKSRLPKRSELLSRDAHPFGTGSGEGAMQVSFQSFNPVAQRDFAPRTEADKEVHVVRHDHVATDTDAELFGPAAVIGERVMQCGVGKDRLSPMGVERHEENGRVEALKDKLEARWLSFDHSSHRRCCSVRCPQRTSSRPWRPSPESAETADATARSADTADAAARSAEDSGRYSTSAPYRAFRRSFV